MTDWMHDAQHATLSVHVSRKFCKMRIIFLILSLTLLPLQQSTAQFSREVPSSQCEKSQYLPIKYFNSLPYVRLEIGAERIPITMLLDTGSSYTTVSDTILERAGGILSERTVTKLGQYGLFDWALSEPLLVSSDGCPLSEIPMTVVTDALRSSERIPRNSRRHLPGYAVLGLDALSQFDVAIDLTNNLLKLTQIETTRSLGSKIALNATLGFQGKQFPCFVDTGASDELKGVFVRGNSDLADYLRSQSLKWRQSSLILSRTDIVSQTLIREFSLGGQAGEDLLLQVEFLADADIDLNTQLPSCIVGMHSLNNMTLEIPANSHNVSLTGVFPSSHYNRSGISAFSRSDLPTGYRIDALLSGGPADLSGLTVGDVIISFEGKSVHEFLFSELGEALSQPAGETVNMGIVNSDGNIRSVELVLHETL